MTTPTDSERTPRTTAGRRLLRQIDEAAATYTDEGGTPERVHRDWVKQQVGYYLRSGVAAAILAIEAEAAALAAERTAAVPSVDVERLADLEHQQWAQWAETVLATEPGISEARRTRWQRLIATPYADLTEAEKHEDRVWAEKVARVARLSPESDNG